MNPKVIRESEKRKFGEEYVDELSKKLKREIRESDHGVPYDFPLYGDNFFSEKQNLIHDVAAAQAAFERDPENAQNLKKYGVALNRLADRMPYHTKREQLAQDAKSMLDKALEMDATDYETMYELGMVLFSILKFNTTLQAYGEGYMKLCHDAISYFKQVQEKAPHIYQDDSWLKELEFEEYMSRWKSSPYSEIRAAEGSYYATTKKVFKDHLSFAILKDQPKWHAKIGLKTTKKQKSNEGASRNTDCDIDTDDEEVEVVSKLVRPTGRKAAKKAARSGGSSHGTSESNLMGFLQNYQDAQASEKIMFRSTLAQMAEATAARAKAKQDAVDMKIMDMDPNDPNISEMKRDWILMKQQEIYDRAHNARN